MLAKYGDKKYTLTYLQGSINKIRVDVERRVKKGGIEALGFCSSNYNKTVIKNELVEIIPLKRTMESRGMLMQVLKDLIEEEGYAEARKDFDINVFKEKEILMGIKDEKFMKELEGLENVDLRKKPKKQEMTTKSFLRSEKRKEDLKAFIFNKRLKGCFYHEIAEEVEKAFDIVVSKGLVTKLFKEACKEQKVEYLTNSDVFFTHKNKVVGWIRNGMPKNEVISKFNEEYGTELNNYYYGLARREAIKC